jgi:serine/threonine protein kinase
MRRGRSGRKEGSTPKRSATIEIEPEKEWGGVAVGERPRLRSKLSISSENFVMCRVGNFDDHYIVISKIGEGSFGSVYRVRHRSLRLERALKTIKKRGPEHFSSFEEIDILKRLDHANILKIYEFYEAPDCYYIITDIFDGKELYDVLLEYPLPHAARKN